MKSPLHIFVLMAGFIIWCSPSFAEDLISLENALNRIYKEATNFQTTQIKLSEDQIANIESISRVTFTGVHSDQVIMHTARKDSTVIGYAFEDTVIGKWGPIHYLLGFDPQGKVVEVIILDYQEIRGKPIAKKRFLRQYKRKTIKDPVLLRRDIDGVTGATISSRSLTDGIRKLLFIFDQYGVTMNKFQNGE